MFSVYGDTVCDPFWGTGTTTLAAMLAARNSVGYELDPDFRAAFEDRLDGLAERSRERARDRLAAHREWVRARREAGDDVGYEAAHYDTAVRTKQERRIRLYVADGVERTDAGYAVTHVPFEP
jgi:hypothetical protein